AAGASHRAAVGRAEVVWVTAPGTATHNAIRQVAAEPHGAVNRRTLIVRMIRVLNPLRHVPMHVVETPGVGLERPNLSRLVGLVVRLAVLRLALSDRVTEGVPRHRPRSRRVFPFRFAQEPVGLPRLAREPADILLRIVPGHADHRPTASPPALIDGPRVTWTAPVSAESAPRPKGPPNLPHAVRPRDRHCGLRTFIPVATRLIRRRPHHKTPRWRHHHLGAIRTWPAICQPVAEACARARL